MREWQHSKGLVPVLFSRRTTWPCSKN